AWEKVDLQIPVRRVSPILYLGRLYVFWIETSTRPLSELSGGAFNFEGYRHKAHLKYSQLRADGRWSAPQGLKFVGSEDAPTDSLIVTEYLQNIDPVSIKLSVPYDIYRRDHPKALENYVPEGWRWQQTYPERILKDGPDTGQLFFGFQPRDYP